MQTDSEAAAIFGRYEAKYRPDQPRVPRGVREGGQWTEDGGGGGAGATELSAASRKGGGHHFVPRGVYEKLPLPEETKKVFENRTTGGLQDRASNRYNLEHRRYNDAVGDELAKYMDEKAIKPEEMTPDQAREFVNRVFESRNPAIRNLNMRIYMREIMRGLWRRSRGTE